MEYIFIHGLGQNPNSWDKVKSFMNKPFSAYCLDLIELLNGKEATYVNLYCAFSDYCNKFSEPLNLCGISLGGVLALNYAIDYPAKVQSLVLIGTQYKMPKILLKIQNGIFRFMPNSIFKSIGFQKKDFITLTKSMMNLDFSNKLKDISCDTLIICGEKDGANKKASMGLADNINNAKFCLLEGAGHEVNTDKPKNLAVELDGFYSNILK